MKLSKFLTEIQKEPATIFKPFNPADLKTNQDVVKRLDAKNVGHAFYKAVEKKILPLVETMVREGVYYTVRSKGMWMAATNLWVEGVETLLKSGVDVNWKDENGQTALHLIAQATNPNNKKIFRMLLDAGADVNAKDNDKETPLMNAVVYADSPEFVSALKAKGADVDSKNNEGKTALCLAVMPNKCNLEIIRSLLAAGADINAESNYGTPLCCLIEDSTTFGNEKVDIEVLTELISRGANVNYVLSEEGYSVLMILMKTAPANISTVAKILLEAGANPNYKNPLYKSYVWDFLNLNTNSHFKHRPTEYKKMMDLARQYRAKYRKVEGRKVKRKK